MNLRNTLSIGALTGLLVASCVAIGHQGVPWLPATDQRHASLSVADANGLVRGAKVLLRGVPIGEITDVVAAADAVRVDLRYAARRRIPVDSSFRIESLSALGESYLSVLPNTAEGPYLDDNQRIDVRSVATPATFGELSAALTRLLDGIEPGTVNTLIDELGSALPTDPAVAQQLARAGSLLTTTLLMSRAPIRDLLVSGQNLLDRGPRIGPALAAAGIPVRDTGTSFATLAQTAIEMMRSNDYPRVVEIGPLDFFRRLREFEDRIGGDTAQLTTRLLPGIQTAAAAMGAIDISRLLDSAVAAVATPGAVTLRVGPPK